MNSVGYSALFPVATTRRKLIPLSQCGLSYASFQEPRAECKLPLVRSSNGGESACGVLVGLIPSPSFSLSFFISPSRFSTFATRLLPSLSLSVSLSMSLSVSLSVCLSVCLSLSLSLLIFLRKLQRKSKPLDSQLQISSGIITLV